jgi:hypothetical protein
LLFVFRVGLEDLLKDVYFFPVRLYDFWLPPVASRKPAPLILHVPILAIKPLGLLLLPPQVDLIDPQLDHERVLSTRRPVLSNRGVVREHEGELFTDELFGHFLAKTTSSYKGGQAPVVIRGVSRRLV